MVIHIYDADLNRLDDIEKITALIWTRRYGTFGEFKLLVPFTKQHVALLQKRRLIMKQGDEEAGEILYVNIRQNAQGVEEIEAQGRFLTNWISKRILLQQIITTDMPQNIIRRIVTETVTNPENHARHIDNITHTDISGIQREGVEYTSEPFKNALLACETVAKSANLGFYISVDRREKQYFFHVHDGRDLTVDQKTNPPCVFSQEFDNILEQEFTNSIENLRSTAFVGGEVGQDIERRILEVGSTATGLARREVFVNATDIRRTFRDEDGGEITMTPAQYDDMLFQRGLSALEGFAETLAFSSKINTHSNLNYREDYDLGDLVTCENRRWGVRINVRIMEITEVYQGGTVGLEITFGESLPALIDKIRMLIN